MTNPSTDPLGAAYAAYEQFESRLSNAMDQFVATEGFAEVFTTTATATLAMSKLVNGAIDQAVRATRFAARQDVVAVARQLARTEEKLERLLQAVERLEDQSAAAPVVVVQEYVEEAPAEPHQAAAHAARNGAPRKRATAKKSAPAKKSAASAAARRGTS